MSSPEPGFDMDVFHRRQSERLRNKREMPPFEGRFADALGKELRRRFPELAPDELVDPAIVADCFAKVPEDRVEGLFQALRRARDDAGELDEAARLWLIELTVYAGVRCVHLDKLLPAPSWTGDASARNAAVQDVRVRSDLVAAVGLAGLNNLRVRLTDDGRVDGFIDLRDVPPGEDVGAALLRAVYDHGFRDARRRRLDPLAPLDEDELGRLRKRFDDLRDEKQLAAVRIRLPETLDRDMQSVVLADVAAALNSLVLRGTDGHDASAFRAHTQITPASLHAKVEDLFGRMAAGKAAGLRASSPAVPAAIRPRTAELSRASVSYTWDVFISHASEDKAAFVEPLVQALRGTGLRVWYDSEQLAAGDSIVEGLNQGLAQSRYGVVVLSPHFLGKHWTQAEVAALFSAPQPDRRSRLLPVRLQLTQSELNERFPLLADRVSIDAGRGMPRVVADILNAVTRDPE